ncbi:MAG: 4Fe-4S ferredoxin [Syntrophus sp. (in: bacteria)]|nr:4Fe-4S ferredoxin [Syntrophus sp. (in: bacteria)]
MKIKRKIIEIDESRCNGCNQCASACAEGAIEIADGKARIVKEIYCDGLGACIGECPEGALTIVEREADDFDAEAVEVHLKNQKATITTPEQFLACGCPSTHMQILTPGSSTKDWPADDKATPSALTHWPVQIRLVPPGAPFLKGAHLLVAADCTPVAYPDFHKDFLRDRAVLIGCPKFDDTAEYINKFRDIFLSAEIKGITILIMEVPCCSQLPLIIREGMALSGKDIPAEVVVVSARGEIIRRESLSV